MRTGLLRWKHNSFIRLRRSRKNYNIFCLSSVDESVGVLWQLCQHVMAINVQLSWHFPYKFCIFRFSAFDNVVAPTSIRAYETQTCFCILDISVHIYSSQSDNCTWWRWKKNYVSQASHSNLRNGLKFINWISQRYSRNQRQSSALWGFTSLESSENPLKIVKP